ncbi:XK-related protein 8-like [Nerophis ophidion]|uniref:XK-related protein 8-like n=1 Tax=Nerophis ophidion TaxID=159077 RepID=UPI002ADFD7CA|nr:XK-related protein 8-like [Nerophis ophidion]XP_061738708.1 XK-related protein 8-like [Nerophis ophidion]
MSQFQHSRVDCILTYLGLVFLLSDICLDLGTAVTFYQEEDYVCLGVLLFLLLGSSVLVQIFSWLWYTNEPLERATLVESRISRSQLKILHVFQLGTYFRHASVMEVTACSCINNIQEADGHAVFLTHDLSMLRLIETFSESAPQLTLMLTIMLRRDQLVPLTVTKALGSASAMALSVTMYHRSMRSFLCDKQKQRPLSSLAYFLWTVVLISSRLAALALFASTLPCFIFAHFLCSWLLMFFCAWRCQTDFMDSPGGEWLYRATVGLIWYFNWFNVVEGRTRNRTLLYHGFILVDMFVLCGTWCWRARAQMSFLHAGLVSVGVVALYILGLVLKVLYYKFFHPNLNKEELKGGDKEVDLDGDVVLVMQPSAVESDVVVVVQRSAVEDVIDGRTPHVQLYNKRMRKLAENFYC